MTWKMTHCPIELTPEERADMEYSLTLLQQLAEKPERFLMLFQPRFRQQSWFSDVLFEKICALVKKEAVKEIGQLEAQLRHDTEQKAPASPFLGRQP